MALPGQPDHVRGQGAGRESPEGPPKIQRMIPACRWNRSRSARLGLARSHFTAPSASCHGPRRWSERCPAKDPSSMPSRSSGEGPPGPPGWALPQT
jgi:hypothetical protein